MNVLKKSDYVTEGLGYLRQAFKGRPQLEALLTAFLQHAQQIEDAAQDLNGLYNIDTASGAQLDGIGAILGAQRNGLSDDQFRLFLSAQVAANHGTATVNAVAELTKKLFQAREVFLKTALCAPYSGVQGAYVVLMVDAPQLPKALWPLAQRLLANNLAAGVELAQLGETSDPAPFALAGSQTGLGGFGSISDATAGGPVGSLISSAA